MELDHKYCFLPQSFVKPIAVGKIILNKNGFEAVPEKIIVCI